MKSWNRFFRQFQNDFKLWLFCLVYSQIYRVIFIYSFRQKISELSGLKDIIVVLLNGLCFDAMIAAYFMLIPLIMSVVCGFTDLEKTAKRVRIFIGGLFVSLSTVLNVLNYGFFKEFNEQFNAFLFQFYYDDTRAIIITVVQDYPFIQYISVMIVVSLLGYFVLRSFLIKELFLWKQSEKHITTYSHKLLVSFLILVFLVISIRGSVDSKPAKRRYINKTGDTFLNKAILNTYSSLRYALMDYKLMNSSSYGMKKFIPDGDIVRAAKYAFSKNEAYELLDDYYALNVSMSHDTPPRHIFIIIGESYNTWPMLEKYKSLRAMEQLKYFARNGLFIEPFLPSSEHTMGSLISIIAGLPDSGILVNYHISSVNPYPTSIAVTFNNLGYTTRFFYGGFPTWQRISDFCVSQGFREVYDGTQLPEDVPKNVWGIEDEYLLDFVIDTVSDDEPSLNLIVMTSNHPPYHVDVESKGFSMKKIPDDILPYWGKNMNMEILGHIWYTDKCIGDFVKAMEKRVSLPLFVITGDHYSRRFLNEKPDYFEQSAVPLVFYGRDVLEGVTLPLGVAGSHLDIGSTLIELTAPEGFLYYSMGQNLLAPREQFIGIARNKIITSDIIIDVENNLQAHPLPYKNMPLHSPSIEHLKKLHDTLHGIAWWRVNNGPHLPGNN